MKCFDLTSKLRSHKSNGLYRSRKVLSSPQSPEIWLEGKRYLAFCSNNYLGLANHPAIISAFQSGSNQYGVGGGASHLILGHNEAHHQLEEELADFTGRDRALLFANGYMANLGAITALLGRNDAVFLDRLNHASLLDAGLLSRASFHRYRHCNSQHLEEMLQHTALQKTAPSRTLIATDGVFSMDGDIAPLLELSTLSQHHNAWLMVDDAHGFGCLGQHGGGVAEHFNLSQHELPVLMGTLSKSFGTYGAFVAGSHELIETLIQFARTYMYTTSIPPAVAVASSVSLKLVKNATEEREHLNKLIRYFRKHYQSSTIKLLASSTPIQPLMVGSVESAIAISDELAKKGILITAIRPPTVPEGTSRLRIALSAAHTFSHIDCLLEALDQVAHSNTVQEMSV